MPQARGKLFLNNLYYMTRSMSLSFSQNNHKQAPSQKLGMEVLILPRSKLATYISMLQTVHT